MDLAFRPPAAQPSAAPTPTVGPGPGRADGHGNQARLERVRSAAEALSDPVVPLPHQSRMEAAFGRSFADVRCHIGPLSAQVGAELGTPGVARGRDVAFADAAPTAWVVAHELAHVVQQSGGTPLPGAGDVEADAEAAASAAVAGRPVQVKARTSESLRLFTGSEHAQIGNEAAEKALDNVGMASDKARLQTDRKGNDTLSYGQACRQAGDKYDTAHELDIGLTRNDKDDYASDADLTKSEVIQDNGNIKSENKAEVRSLLSEARSEGYDKDNNAHTWKVNKLEWQTFHDTAIDKAAQGKLQSALRHEAFAAHFLQDAHAAGHMVPRSVEQAAGGHRLREPETGVSWHDYFNEHGVPTTKGILYGDGFLDKSPVCVMRATRASLEEVLTAYQTGEPVTSQVGARFPEPLTTPEELAEMPKPDKRMDGQELTVSDEGYQARAEGLVPKFLEMLAAYEGDYEELQARVAAGDETVETAAGHEVSLDWLVAAFDEWFERV